MIKVDNRDTAFRWHKVKDELPPLGEAVLTITCYEECDIEDVEIVFEHDNQGKCWFYNSRDDFEPVNREPDLWMYIPEPTKEDYSF
jgi:hypothetical protein